MPIIPLAQGSQVLQAGSPVPIASPSEARLSGEATEGLGRAIAGLGATMHEAATRAKIENDRVIAEDAENQFRMRTLKEQAAAAAAAPVAEDATGFKAVENFQSKLNEARMEIAERIPTPEARREFLSNSGKMVALESTGMLALEVKKRAEAAKGMQEKVLSDYGAIARMSPNETEYMMKQAQISVESNNNYTPADKVLMARVAPKAVLADGIQGRMLRNDYNGALKDLERLSPGVLSVEEKNKQYDEIVTAKHKYFSESEHYTKQDSIRQENQQKKVQKDNYRASYSALVNAGNSEILRAPVIEQILKKNEAGLISDKDADRLINSKTFSKAATTTATARIMTDAVKTGNFEEAFTKLGDDPVLGNNSKSIMDVTDKLTKLQQKYESNPEFKTQLSSGEKLLRVIDDQSLTSSMSPAELSEFRGNIDKAVNEFYSSMTNNSDQDPGAVSRQIFLNSYKVANEPPGVTPATIRQEQAELTEEFRRIKSKGTLTKEIDKDMQKKMQKLEFRRKKLEALIGSQQMQPNPLPAKK